MVGILFCFFLGQVRPIFRGEVFVTFREGISMTFYDDIIVGGLNPNGQICSGPTWESFPQVFGVKVQKKL